MVTCSGIYCPPLFIHSTTPIPIMITIPIPILSSSKIMMQWTHKGGYPQYLASDFAVGSVINPNSPTSQPPYLVVSAIPTHVIITFVDLLLLIIRFHPPPLPGFLRVSYMLILLLYNSPTLPLPTRRQKRKNKVIEKRKYFTQHREKFPPVPRSNAEWCGTDVELSLEGYK